MKNVILETRGLRMHVKANTATSQPFLCCGTTTIPSISAEAFGPYCPWSSRSASSRCSPGRNVTIRLVRVLVLFSILVSDFDDLADTGLDDFADFADDALDDDFESASFDFASF